MTSPPTDICLLLEGTYPYISGGVSTWIHNLVSSLPDLTFSGLCILPTAEANQEIKYELPPNFKELRTIYLHDHEATQNGEQGIGDHRRIEALVQRFHKELKGHDLSSFASVMSLIAPRNGGQPQLTIRDMMHGREAWQILLDLYNPDQNDSSFIDFFWTYRLTHLPLIKLLTTEIPKAAVYHTICTGYAGILGKIAKSRYQRPLLLTEHGIYVKERKIEISQAQWIYQTRDMEDKVVGELGAFHQQWISFFEALSRITYDAADAIFTLYEGNRQLEIAQGAEPDKIEIIPNGIDVELYSGLQRKRSSDENPAVGFVGRVVAIKDVKTFLRACKIVSLRLPMVKFYILGPTDEDKKYYEECQEMTKLLGIAERVEFTGKVRVADYYPRLDLIVLTSLSEAQPLVILEANCAGLPVVASNVGACRELIEGRESADRNLGPSGIITPVADPTETARAISTILNDPKMYRKMSEAGRQRVAAYYRESDLSARYHDIYSRYRRL